MSKFFTSKKPPVTLSEVNVIPLVDIVFTLLIIFMIMAPVIHKGIDVQVPESSVGDPLPEHQYHIISISSEGSLWFDDQETTMEGLPQHLQTLDQEDTLYVRSDKTVPYGLVIDLITEIKAYGIGQVGLVTNPRKSPAALPE